MWRSAFLRLSSFHTFIASSSRRIRIPRLPFSPSQSSYRFFSVEEPQLFESPIPADSPNMGPFISHEGIHEHDDAPWGNLDSLDNNDVGEESLEQNATVSDFEGKRDVCEIDLDKLENVLSLLQSTPHASLETSLNDMDLVLHDEFVTKVLQTPFIAADSLIRFVMWAWKVKSFRLTSHVMGPLVLAVCSGDPKKREIYSLWDLIKLVNEKEDNNGVLNVEIVNQLLASLSKLGKGKAAFDVFSYFEQHGGVPNGDTYYFTLEALCRRSFFDWACSVCQKMIDAESLPSGERVGEVISWFCKAKNAKVAHQVYIVAREKRQDVPVSCVSFLIGQLSRENETVPLALEMLEDVIREDKKHAMKPYSAVVQALCRIKDVDGAKRLVLRMIAEGPPPGNAVFNYVITGYSKIGEMDRALEMVKLMETRGLRPDVYTYTVLTSAYANGGEMEKAQEVFTEAKKKYSELSPVIYHTLIRGYCKLEQFEKALELLAEMKNFGVRPTVDEYEKLIQSLCLKALDWRMAEKLLEEMKENGLYLKGITRALITAVKELEKEVVETENVSLVA